MLNRLKFKFASWMQGRYGMDHLYKALIAVYFVLIVLNLFIGSAILNYAAMLLVLFAFLRVFSKQTAKRALENRKYVTLRDSAKKRDLLLVNRVKEFKTHRYRNCPNCRSTLRLQKKIGTMTVTCPKCRTSFQVTVRR
jgi:ssDNA-binding Zn-finger/Zn-ribbon topoisomerase 1